MHERSGGEDIRSKATGVLLECNLFWELKSTGLRALKAGTNFGFIYHAVWRKQQVTGARKDLSSSPYDSQLLSISTIMNFSPHLERKISLKAVKLIDPLSISSSVFCQAWLADLLNRFPSQPAILEEKLKPVIAVEIRKSKETFQVDSAKGAVVLAV